MEERLSAVKAQLEQASDMRPKRITDLEEEVQGIKDEKAKMKDTLKVVRSELTRLEAAYKGNSEAWITAYCLHCSARIQSMPPLASRSLE